MEITRLGTNRSAITLIYAPPQTVLDPHIIDKTRWILLTPDMLDPLLNTLSTRRADRIAANTWQAIHAPYLLRPHTVTRHNNTTIYRFGRKASAVTLIHTAGEPIHPSRYHRTSLVTLDPLAMFFVKTMIRHSPRNRHAAITYLKSIGMPLSSIAMTDLFRAIPEQN